MSTKLIFSVLLLSVMVLARPDGPKEHGKPEGHKGPKGPGGPKGPHGHGGPGLPPFLANVSAEGKKEFEKIFKNDSLKISEVDTQLAALAEKYGVAAIFKQFQANITAHLAEIKKNQTTVISNLSSVSDKLQAIFSNKDQTRVQQREAVEAVRKEHPVEVDALRFIRSKLEGPKGRHGGPHGGPKGGPRKEEKEEAASGSDEDSAEA